MRASHSPKSSQYLCLTALCRHAEVSSLDLFHQGHGHTIYAAIHCRSFQFDSCHGPNCSRHICKTSLGIRIPRHHITGLSLVDDIIGDHAQLPRVREILHHVTQERNGVRWHSIQSMPGLITPHQTVDNPIHGAHRHIDTHQPPAGSTFRSNEPRERPITGRPFLNSLSMHPIAAPADKHVGPASLYPIFPGYRTYNMA